MAKRKAPDPSLARSAEPLYREIRAVLESARAGAFRAVNAAMVQAYWNVGRLIVEHEQGGAKRAAYGEAVLEELSRRLTAEFGRGFTATNLRYIRQFYRAFPIHHAPRDESESTGNLNGPRSESPGPRMRAAVRLESNRGWFPAGVPPGTGQGFRVRRPAEAPPVRGRGLLRGPRLLQLPAQVLRADRSHGRQADASVTLGAW